MSIPYDHWDDEDEGTSSANVLVIRDHVPRRNEFSSEYRKKYDKIVRAGGSVHVMVDEHGANDGPVYAWGNFRSPAFESYADWLASRRPDQKDSDYG